MTAMEKFLMAMSPSEMDAYRANSDKNPDELDNIMQGVLRVKVYMLFSETQKVQGNHSRSPEPRALEQRSTPPPGFDNFAAKNRFNMNSMANSLPGSQIEIKVTINAPVTQLLNADDRALSREIKRTFNVDSSFGAHYSLNNCTFALFCGNGKELALAQDKMWEFLQPHQECRAILVSESVNTMWNSWPDAQKTLFRNRTNVNIGQTDCRDEVVLRGFHHEHIDKVKKILQEYARFGMLPKNDKQLLKRMWGTKE